MRKFRQKYYDRFSMIYDRFVALHSSDRQGTLRRYLAEKTDAAKGDRILDICTGTGSILQHLNERVRNDGVIVGIDFSMGMLKAAKEKTSNIDSVFLIQADVARLPFKENVFDAITCAHAFYELKGEDQEDCLKEIPRTLKSGKYFLMMEHDIPENIFIRMLFFIRLLSMGRKRAFQVLKQQSELLSRYFRSVEKIETPSGRSIIMRCKL